MKRLQPPRGITCIPEKRQYSACATDLSSDTMECNEDKSTCITDLPQEVILKIFAWFAPRELYATISPVCTVWRQLSRDPSLWKELCFRGNSIPTDVASILLQHSPQLERLEMLSRVDGTALLELVSRHNTQLKVLIMKRCRGTQESDIITSEVLINVIKKCSQITDLTLKDTQFRGNKFYLLLGTSLPKLRRVNFSYNAQFGSSAISAIAKHCPPLEEFIGFRSLGSNSRFAHCSDHDVQCLCTSMGSTLKVLKLNAAALTDDCIETVATCQHLETLHMRCAINLSTAGIMKLLKFQKLKSLSITMAVHIPTPTWCSLFSEDNWSGLEKLGLALCYHVHDEVLQCISQRCRNLEKLRLTGCVHITQTGLTHIFEQCNKLKHLNIVLMHTTVLKAFPAIPDCLPHLETLIFGPIFDDDINLEHGIVKDLRNKLPNLIVYLNR